MTEHDICCYMEMETTGTAVQRARHKLPTALRMDGSRVKADR